jgi:Flp pilus assembly protein TadD
VSRFALGMALLLALVPSVRAQGRIDRVVGTVRDERGQTVDGAVVVAENPNAMPHLFTARTDVLGGFVLVGMEPGAWVFTAWTDGYEKSQVVVRLGRRAPMPLVLVLRKGGWAPTAPTADGPLAGVDVARLQTALKNAETLLDAGQYDAAISAYREVQLRAPALTMVNLALGDAWRSKKECGRAMAAYGEVLRHNPGNELALLGTARCALDGGDAARADAVLSPAAAGTPGKDMLCTLGDIRQALHRDDEAAVFYRKAAASDPGWARPVLKLGVLAAARGDRRGAEDLFVQVIRLAPHSPEAAEAARALDALRK